MLACEVAPHDVPVGVLERLPEIKTHPKVEGITGRAIDILDRRGLMNGIDGAHVHMPGSVPKRAPSGFLGGHRYGDQMGDGPAVAEGGGRGTARVHGVGPGCRLVVSDHIAGVASDSDGEAQ
ncbi:hypothetical protein ACIBQ1_23975 [Nonomuraea sp. NPDC050153]|uniref:hypothetical protein n=1 Tax=Nonomuraea sp. NPDC050153 TaxID=3364359 RepID=UPI003792991A